MKAHFSFKSTRKSTGNHRTATDESQRCTKFVQYICAYPGRRVDLWPHLQREFRRRRRQAKRAQRGLGGLLRLLEQSLGGLEHEQLPRVFTISGPDRSS